MSNPVTNQYLHYSSSLRSCLPRSADVDMLLFLLKLKPSLRTLPLQSSSIQALLKEFCAPYRFSFSIDQEGYCFISRTIKVLEQLIALDHSPVSHEIELGMALGYPQCCCEKIQEVGEACIDTYESSLKMESFEGAFSLIDPCGYQNGSAFISHVPCCATCRPSLKIAQQCSHFLAGNASSGAFAQWNNLDSKAEKN